MLGVFERTVRKAPATWYAGRPRSGSRSHPPHPHRESSPSPPPITIATVAFPSLSSTGSHCVPPPPRAAASACTHPLLSSSLPPWCWRQTGCSTGLRKPVGWPACSVTHTIRRISKLDYTSDPQRK
ncbi:hypothetical protein U9M48_004397 [Paspalum notatum var. saurae]|uniref:Uncharacterized protein n=1 Tax=Paspalum notatum var. saurae TaxID=547442 RepID=A0AAQ3PKF9_PASNO